MLGLKPKSTGDSTEEYTAREKANSIAKSSIILMLSEQVQFCAIAYCDDENKTTYELWEFLESAYTASNEQAIQNSRIKLDLLVYVEGTD